MNSTAVEKLLTIARNEIGYLEKETNSNLDSKTDNVGDENYTKYARDLDQTILYNGKKNGYAWCDMFVDWCFIKAFGFDKALELTCQPTKGYGAGCTASARYYREKNQFFKSNPIPGDQIFFTKDGGKNYYHTGLVEKVVGDRVYTIEGNTSSEAGVVENGGAVRDKSYKLSYSQIGGYGRPNYNLLTNNIISNKIIEASIKYSPLKSGVIRNASIVNVRTGPGTKYSKIGTLNKDSKISISGTDSSKKWYKFKDSTYKEAWISASYVVLLSDIIELTYTSPKTGKVLPSRGLNVRKGPDVAYDKIGAIPQNSKVTILAVSKDKKWYRIKTNKYPIGWVSSSYITIISNESKEPLFKTAIANLNIRNGRGVEYRSIGIIPKGTKVEVSELESNWYKVKYNNIVGYSSANYLK